MELLNSLPDDVVLADLLLTFRCHMKHYLLQQSYQMSYSNCVTVILLVVLAVPAATWVTITITD